MRSLALILTILAASAALVGLDAAGHIQWAKRYSFGGPGANTASGNVAVRLSDDGGAVATALVKDPLDPLGGLLWVFKPFPKDGSIDFVAGEATALPLDISELDCFMTASNVDIAITPVDVPTRSVSVSSVPATLDVTQQTELATLRAAGSVAVGVRPASDPETTPSAARTTIARSAGGGAGAISCTG